MRQRDREARDAFANVDVEVVERAGAELDRTSPGPGRRVVDLLEPENVRAAELVEPTLAFTTPSSRPPRRLAGTASDAAVYV